MHNVVMGVAATMIVILLASFAPILMPPLSIRI
jgi:hypothetical protein